MSWICPCSAINADDAHSCRRCGLLLLQLPARRAAPPVNYEPPPSPRTRKAETWTAVLGQFLVAGFFIFLSLSFFGVFHAKEVSPANPLRHIGERFSIGYWTYICNDVTLTQRMPSIERTKAADGIFVIVEVTVRNDDRSASVIPPFQLVDSEGREYDPSGTLEDGFFEAFDSLNPDMSKQGLVFFDVPPGRVYQLRVRGGFHSAEAALVDLGLEGK